MAIKLRLRSKGQRDAVSHAGAVGAGLPSATLLLPAGPGRETSGRKKWHLGGLKNLVRRGPEILHRGRAVLPQRNAPGRGDAPLIPAKSASLHALGGPRHEVMRAAMGDFARWLASPEFESSRLESNLSDIIGAIPEALGHADTPLAVRLAFEVSDGRQALAEFKEAIRATELAGQQKVPDSLLDAKFDQTFFACFDRAVASPHARVAQRNPLDGQLMRSTSGANVTHTTGGSGEEASPTRTSTGMRQAVESS